MMYIPFSIIKKKIRINKNKYKIVNYKIERTFKIDEVEILDYLSKEE